MDTKHKQTYARVKLLGRSEPQLFNEGLSLIRLLGAIGMWLGTVPVRYDSIHTIELGFKPFTEHETDLEKFQREITAGLDLSSMTFATDSESEAIQQAWAANPTNPQSDSYDALLHEYMLCASSKRRESKTPQDLATLRKHVESTYRGTEWWDGSHRW